jgi:predicted RNA-binding protein with PUA-like domain
MAYWLVKSEPSVYSWEQFEKDKQTFWDGVRNYAARNHLKTMKVGEQVLYYHSNEGLEIVGIAKVAKEWYQDPSTDDDRWVAVDLYEQTLVAYQDDKPVFATLVASGVL